jgi:membrane fusion protein, copper/silver efflux system
MNKSFLLVGSLMLVLGIAIGAGYSSFSVKTSNSDPVADVREPLYYRNAMNPTVTSPVPAKDSMGMDYVPVYAEDSGAPREREVVFYRSPMNPSVTSPVPAKDSMGMDYIPVYADGNTEANPGLVKIDPVVAQNIGVRTAKAEQKTMGRTVRALGRVDYDEERMSRLHPKTEGWIEEIYVDKTGQKVKRGDILLSIYSPKLVSAQQEYLLAINNQKTLANSPFEELRKGADDLLKSSRQRLTLLDVPEHQIDELERTQEIKKDLHIHSSVDGTVIRIGSRAGQYVTPKTELYMIVDLSRVWVYSDIYEYELPWVKEGDEVTMTLASVPGRTFSGTLSYIYPYSESNTRTTKVRLEFDNSDNLLRPDMFSNVSIVSDKVVDSVVIPSEAVVRTGNRDQVYIVREPGKYEPRVVTLGVESDGEVVILSGLDPQEEVVTSAQFLVDSESKLREATAKMMKASQEPSQTTSMPVESGVDIKASVERETSTETRMGDEALNNGHVDSGKAHRHD